jgi:hypothetical protein
VECVNSHYLMQAHVGLDDTVSNNWSYFVTLIENSENVTSLLGNTYYLHCFLKEMMVHTSKGIIYSDLHKYKSVIENSPYIQGGRLYKNGILRTYIH